MRTPWASFQPTPICLQGCTHNYSVGILSALPSGYSKPLQRFLLFLHSRKRSCYAGMGPTAGTELGIVGLPHSWTGIFPSGGSHFERLGLPPGTFGPPGGQKGTQKKIKCYEKARHPGASRVSCFWGHFEKAKGTQMALETAKGTQMAPKRAGCGGGGGQIEIGLVKILSSPAAT
jgi:hypothetical protein